MRGFGAMYDYQWKKWGIILSAISLIAMIAERISGFIIFQKYNGSQHYAIFWWVMLLGLFIVIWSKEKFDDDRAKAIRLKSYHMAFSFVVAASMAIALSSKLATRTPTLTPETILMVISGGIIMYLLFFHIGLYFDFLWDYGDRGLLGSLIDNKNLWGILVYYICAAITLAVLLLITP